MRSRKKSTFITHEESRSKKNISATIKAATLGTLLLATFTVSPVLYVDYKRKEQSAHYAQQIVEQSGGALTYKEKGRAFYFDIPFVEGKLTPEARVCSETIAYENHVTPIIDKHYSAYSCTLIFEELGPLEARIIVPIKEITKGEESERGKRFQRVLQEFDSGEKMYIRSERFESEKGFLVDLGKTVKRK